MESMSSDAERTNQEEENMVMTALIVLLSWVIIRGGITN